MTTYNYTFFMPLSEQLKFYREKLELKFLYDDSDDYLNFADAIKPNVHRKVTRCIRYLDDFVLISNIDTSKYYVSIETAQAAYSTQRYEILKFFTHPEYKLQFEIAPAAICDGFFGNSKCATLRYWLKGKYQQFKYPTWRDLLEDVKRHGFHV